MSFNAGLAERLQLAVADLPGMTENRMMGGFGYLLNGNMCMGSTRTTSSYVLVSMRRSGF